MERRSRFRYNLGHETPGNRSAAGSTTPTGNPVAKSGQEPVGDGACCECVGEFGVAMVPGVPSERVGRASPSSHSWASAQALGVPKGEAAEALGGGPSPVRICHGPVDAEARGRGDRTIVWRALSPLPRVESPGEVGLELPEAGAPRPGAGRSGNREMAQAALAAYKKTPGSKHVASFFSTKAALCCSRWCDARGPRGVRPHSMTMGAARSTFSYQCDHPGTAATSIRALLAESTTQHPC